MKKTFDTLGVLCVRLAIEARKRCIEDGFGGKDVRIFGCLPPICDSHNPAIFAEYLQKYGQGFVTEAYEQVSTSHLLLLCFLFNFMFANMNVCFIFSAFSWPGAALRVVAMD